MSRRLLLATACMAALALAACSQNAPADAAATGAAAEGVTVSAAWIRETPPTAAVAGGYLTLRSAIDDRLVSVETPASASVEIHEMRHGGGVMQMRELPDGVELPAGTEVALAPGGNHLMFIAPVEPIRAGQSIEATLVFEHAPRQAVTFEVRPLAGDAPAQDAAHDAHAH